MKITVNGRAIETESAFLSYERIVELAGMTGNPSCTYRWRGPGDSSRGGILYGEKTIELAEGMVFNLAHTGNS